MAVRTVDSGPPRHWVQLDFPPEFRIGLHALAEMCGWRVRDSASATWVCDEDRYLRRLPTLVSADLIVDAENASDDSAYEAIGEWALRDPIQVDTSNALAGVPITADMSNPQTTEDVWTVARLRVMLAPPAQIAREVAGVFRWVAKQSPGASLWLIHADPKVSARVAAARALHAAQQSPELLSRPANEFRGFLPNVALTRSLTLGLSSFIDPLLMTVSPWLLGMSFPRRTGSILILFGEYRAGFQGVQTTEILNLLRPAGVSEVGGSVRRPDLSPSAATDFVRWWTGRLNRLLTKATDPALFQTDTRAYAPSDHLGLLLSLERLFGALQSMLAHSRHDEVVRLLLGFNVIDQLQGLGFLTWPRAFSEKASREALSGLADSIGAPAEAVLSRCRAAVEALNAVTNGWELNERRDGNTIRVRTRAGEWSDMPIEEATWRYVRVIRNAGHSFTNLVRDKRDLSLLASHGGDIPDELSDLALLQGLAFLENPTFGATNERATVEPSQPGRPSFEA